MKTTVGLYHEPKRKLPWLVTWWGEPDPSTGRQRKHTKSFRYKADARTFQRQKQAEVDRGPAPTQERDRTLGELIGEFKRARLAGASYSSQCCYANTFGQLFEHFGSGRKLSQIQQRHAETFIATRKRRDGRPGDLSTWSRFQHLKHAKCLFGAAVAWGWIDRNPFKPADRGGATPLRIKARSRPWHHIPPDEFGRFLEHVPTPRQRVVFWLMYGCGLRPGEVYNLTVDNLDLQGRRVHIENRVGTDDVPPFTVKADNTSAESKERSVPIPAAAIPDLMVARVEAPKAGGFVALTPERFKAVRRDWRLCRAGKPWGGRTTHRPWLNRDMVNNVLRQARLYMRKAGVELTAPLALTTFRKSFGQNHADAGTPPRTLAKLMGHSDVQTTLTFYARVTDSNERAAAETSDRLFAKVGASVRNAG